MKNKKLMYVLIPLTLLIWGIIILKIFNQVHPDRNSYSQSTSVIQQVSNQSDRDTLSLLLNYRDPFLHGVVRSVTNTMPKENISNGFGQLSTATHVAVNFPNTKYSGLVINSKSKSKVGLIRINEKDYLAKEGELIGGGKIIRLFADSVIISFNKTKKTFLRNILN